MIRLLLAPLFAIAAIAGDVTGIWTGQLPGLFGEVDDISFRIVRNASGLSGKVYGNSESSAIHDVKLEGSVLTFVVVTEMNGGQRKFVYNGVVEGNRMQMTRRRELLPGDTDPEKKKTIPQRFVVTKLID